MSGSPSRTVDARPGPSWYEERAIELLPDLLDGARSMTGDPDEAEDLVARTVARGWERQEELRDPARLRGWLFRILRNCFLADRRRRDGRPERVELPCEDDARPDFSLFEQLHQPFLLWRENPEERFLDELLHEDLENAVEALPECYRTVVTLVDVRGLRYAEVAEALDLPVGTVRSRLARARARLQEHLWDHAVDRGLRDPEAEPGE